MASKKNFNPNSESDHLFEFDESDMWSSNQVPFPKPESKKPSKRMSNKVDMVDRSTPAKGSSLPVNVPDWSKIAKQENGNEYDDDDDDDDEERIPPHEYLARKRGDSSSVYEGIGRTLKGRDLHRVRNLIWEKIGYED